MVAEAHKTGEPILRALEYNYPHQGYESITDMFMLGEDILVAPVIVKGQTERDVVLPKGRWRDSDGTEYEGGNIVKISVPIDKLAYFEKN